MNIELDVERKATPLSAFPKNEHGKPGIFVKKAKDDKAEYCCFCIKDIYSDLFAGTKKEPETTQMTPPLSTSLKILIL